MHDGHALSAKPVKETAFPDIRAPDKGDGSGWIDHFKKNLEVSSEETTLRSYFIGSFSSKDRRGSALVLDGRNKSRFYL
jgi:hypothetical protein